MIDKYIIIICNKNFFTGIYKRIYLKVDGICYHSIENTIFSYMQENM